MDRLAILNSEYEIKEILWYIEKRNIWEFESFNMQVI